MDRHCAWTEGPVGVVAVDDSPVFRRAIAHILAGDPRVRLLGIAERGAAAVPLIERLSPRVALIDQRMPGLSGADLIRRLCSRFPDLVMVALTVSENDDDIADILRAGARGYVLKANAGTEVIGAVLAADRGDSWLSPRIASKLIDSYAALPSTAIRHSASAAELTPRERAVLAHLAQGMTNRGIATALRVAETTVKSHVGRIINKLGVANRAEATATAWRLQLAGDDGTSAQRTIRNVPSPSSKTPATRSGETGI